MELFKLYESLLREEVSNGVQACVTKYGKELFAPQFGGEEPNTDAEDDAIADIGSFTNTTFGSRIAPKFVDEMQDLKKCISAFPEVLYPEGVAYRGVAIPLKNLIPVISNINLDRTFKYNYAARTKIQSWTSSYEVADDFGSAAVGPFTYKFIYDVMDKNLLKDKLVEFSQNESSFNTFLDFFRVPIVLKHTASPDQFLFKAKYFSALSNSEDEDEVIRVTNEPIAVEARIPNTFTIEGSTTHFIEYLKPITDGLKSIGKLT